MYPTYTRLIPCSVSPSMSLNVINNRLALVESLLDETFRSDVRALLHRSSDTLRLLQRFLIGRGDADDLLALARTMEVTENIYAILENRITDARANAQSTAVDVNALFELLGRIDLEEPARLSKSIFNAI